MDNQLREIYELYNTIISQKKLISESPNIPVFRKLISPLEIQKKDWNITSGFDVIRNDGKPHGALDIGVKSGSKVIAPADGVVTVSSFSTGDCGGTVTIKHSNGLETGFCHLKQIDVTLNQEVMAGDVIGLSGGGANDKGKGSSTGEHLHYQLKLNGVPVDPSKYTGSLLEVVTDNPLFENLDPETKTKVLEQIKNILSNVGIYGGIAAATAVIFKFLMAFKKSPSSTTPNTNTQSAAVEFSTIGQPADQTAKYVGDVIRGVLPGFGK